MDPPRSTGELVDIPSLPPRVVLFDGVCNVCNAAVNFIIDRDPSRRFHFASLQSAVGRKVTEAHGIEGGIDTVVLVEEGRAYTESSAVLQVARHLGGLWPLLRVFVVIPRAIRDPLYRYFAANRYRWFGRRQVCRVPAPEVRERFIE
jgi:predicted DCC family thiol-disulfide oxidoreductase YuxK